MCSESSTAQITKPKDNKKRKVGSKIEKNALKLRARLENLKKCICAHLATVALWNLLLLLFKYQRVHCYLNSRRDCKRKDVHLNLLQTRL